MNASKAIVCSADESRGREVQIDLSGWCGCSLPGYQYEPISTSILPLPRHLGDQPRAALEGEVVPQPGERHDETVAQPDQEIDVGDAPEQPAEEALEVQRPHLHHRGAPSDRGEVAGVVIAERGPGLPIEPRRDQLADIAAHLLGDWRHPGQRLAV